MQGDIYLIELDKRFVLCSDKLLYLDCGAELIGKIFKEAEVLIVKLEHCKSVLHVCGIKHGHDHCPASVIGQVTVSEQVF